MKKVMLFFAFLLSLMSLASCGTSSTAISTPMTTIKATPMPVPEQIPTYVQGIYDNYAKILTENTFSVSLNKNSLKQTNAIKDGQYEFSVSGGEFNIPQKVYFYAYNNITEKSFYMMSDFDKAVNSTKDLITIVLMATNPSLDKISAVKQMTEIVYSYKEKGPSKVIQSGDFYVFLASRKTKNIEAVHKDELFATIDKTKYAKVDYQAALHGKVNAGTKFYLTGKVKSFTKTWDSMFGTEYLVAFQCDDGNTYYLDYMFDHTPIELSKGIKYTVYGYVADNTDSPTKPIITIDLVEE